MLARTRQWFGGAAYNLGKQEGAPVSTTTPPTDPPADDHQPERTGRFLGIPYDWRKPTWARFKSRVWNSNEPRIWTPRYYGWGYDLNLYQLWRRIRRRL